MTALTTKIARVKSLIDSRDVTEIENDFLKSVVEITDDGKHPERLTLRQQRWVEDIWQQHYA